MDGATAQLRSMETSLEFIGDRQMDGRKTQILTGYMKHSFAYGSTFYQSWLQVFKNQVLAEAVEHMRGTGKLYGVLGSSIGWHVFYGALTWEVRARGWEILCSQVEIAKTLAAAHGLDNRTEYTGAAPSSSSPSADSPGRAVAARFECLDALQADLAGVHVLVLAFSRDVDLGAVLNRKMAAELRCACEKSLAKQPDCTQKRPATDTHSHIPQHRRACRGMVADSRCAARVRARCRV